MSKTIETTLKEIQLRYDTMKLLADEQSISYVASVCAEYNTLGRIPMITLKTLIRISNAIRAGRGVDDTPVEELDTDELGRRHRALYKGGF